MSYCIYNAIQTPDGTILHCENGHDFKSYKDTVSGETYMNDGLGYGIRRSINKVKAKDLSIHADDDFEIIRTVKFWGSYGKDGNQEKVMMSLEEMENDHIDAILSTQKHLKGSEIEELFKKEIEYRIKQANRDTNKAKAKNKI